MRTILSTGALLLLAACGGDSAGNDGKAPAPAGIVGGEGIDCAAASSPAATIVCGDARLVRLDVETARLTRLARGDPQASPDLSSEEEDWIEERDRCAADGDPLTCFASEYAEHIHALREGSAKARSEDEAGISIGPIAFRCVGMDALLSATFVNADPGLVRLDDGDEDETLVQGPSASGARYTAEAGAWLFWNKGREAVFKRPGVALTGCREETSA